MSDLIDRLMDFDSEGITASDRYHLRTEAADTIASLTAEVAEWKQAAQVEAGLRREFLARAEAAEAQVEKLRAEIAKAGHSLDIGYSKEHVSEMLRTALQSTEGDGR